MIKHVERLFEQTSSVVCLTEVGTHGVSLSVHRINSIHVRDAETVEIAFRHCLLKAGIKVASQHSDLLSKANSLLKNRQVRSILISKTNLPGTSHFTCFLRGELVGEWGEVGEKRAQYRIHAVEQGQTLQSALTCLLYTSPSPRDGLLSRMPSSA